MGDVLLRRTRLGLLDARRLCAPDAEGPLAVAQAMAGELGWDDARVEREVGAWRELARREGLVPELDVVPVRSARAGGAVRRPHRAQRRRRPRERERARCAAASSTSPGRC